MGAIDLVLNTIHMFLLSYVSAVSTRLSSVVGAVLVAFVTIQILLHGYETVMGRPDPVTGLLMKWGRVWIYSAIGLTLGVGNGQIFKFFNSIANWLVSTLALSVGGSTGSASGIGGVETAINSFWQQLLNIIATILDAGTGTSAHPGFLAILFSHWSSIGAGIMLSFDLFVLAALFLIGGALVTVGFLMVYLTAQIGLMACLALAPIFVTMGGFKKTENYFNSWLSQVLNFVLLTGLTGMLFGLGIAMCDRVEQRVLMVLQGLQSQGAWRGAVAPLFVDMVAWIVMALLIYYFFDQLPSLSSGLVGGSGLQNANDWFRSRLQTAAERRFLQGRGGPGGEAPSVGGGSIQRGVEDAEQLRTRRPSSEE